MPSKNNICRLRFAIGGNQSTKNPTKKGEIVLGQLTALSENDQGGGETSWAVSSGHAGLKS